MGSVSLLLGLLLSTLAAPHCSAVAAAALRLGTTAAAARRSRVTSGGEASPLSDVNELLVEEQLGLTSRLQGVETAVEQTGARLERATQALKALNSTLAVASESLSGAASRVAADTARLEELNATRVAAQEAGANATDSMHARMEAMEPNISASKNFIAILANASRAIVDTTGIRAMADKLKFVEGSLRMNATQLAESILRRRVDEELMRQQEALAGEVSALTAGFGH
mmetsp:Transcript_67728/g.175431  ORF Transcript_67728/g.175431 Transcript_67728/m.175431 type:complete len:228 (+) Transcript_67728:70-753(+)